jgi:hypothetical protein
VIFYFLFLFSFLTNWWGMHAALAATGIIWVRYSFVIKPVNYSLAAVSKVPPSVPIRFSLVRLG